MLFRLFTLHPDIFQSFVSNSLIARAVSKNIISFELINWREQFGIGNYKQVDDKPFGGGSGMVLMAEPIIQAMEQSGSINSPKLDEPITKIDSKSKTKQKVLPNNSSFYESIQNGSNKTKKVNIMTTPRGFGFNQEIATWIASNFEEVNILCGRYEGFDARINQTIDLELSIGNFVLNGGEVGAMCMVEAIARLVPDFITKNTSVAHDSWSSGLNNYNEFAFDNGSTTYQKHFTQTNQKPNQSKLFDDSWWLTNVLPHIEHPQYTRPQIWRGQSVPEILLGGDHLKIQKWRQKWF